MVLCARSSQTAESLIFKNIWWYLQFKAVNKKCFQIQAVGRKGGRYCSERWRLVGGLQSAVNKSSGKWLRGWRVQAEAADETTVKCLRLMLFLLENISAGKLKRLIVRSLFNS